MSRCALTLQEDVLMRCKTEALYDPWFQLAVFEPQDATDHYKVNLVNYL